MLIVEKVNFIESGSKICFLCRNHFDIGDGLCPDCNKFWDKYTFGPGKFRVLFVNKKAFRVYSDMDKEQIINHLKKL